MMEFSPGIDRSSAVPFHFQLREILEDEISSGRLGPGDRLPSEPFLSSHYHVSRTTVRQALYALEQKGLIRKEKGRGAFVSRASPGSWLLQSVGGLFDDELSRHGVKVESTVLAAVVGPLPEWPARALQLPAESPGITLERVRRLDGKTAIYVVNYLPADYAGLLPELVSSPTASLYRLLRERYGVDLTGSSRVLEAVPAPKACASRLEVARNSPVAFIESVSWDATGRNVDCYRAWLRTDRLQISVVTQTWESSTGRVVSRSMVGVPVGDLTAQG